jgi:hypothetical protein
MIPFKYLNNKYYSIPIQSYTSNDEFILNKRIWENGELNAWDTYDASHSLLHDELWKWFLGSTSVSYDVPYNYETEGQEYFDNEDVITHASIAKYVNGVRAKNYGPIPTYHFEKDASWHDGGMSDDERPYSLKEDLSGPALTYQRNSWVYRPVWPSYTRYDIEGTVLPEADFLLHEGYRYLQNLYPDHPDWNTLLTTNEINDEFNQIATLIDFPINCSFYDWLATQLDYSSSIEEVDLFQLYKDEALKLKFKNLTKHAFRRKLFGAKAGYWMFGAEAFQHVTIYPVAEYLPLKPHLINEKDPYVSGELISGRISGVASGVISGYYSGRLSGIFDGTLVSGISGASGVYEDTINYLVDGTVYGNLSGEVSGLLDGTYNARFIDSKEASDIFYHIGESNDFKWYKKLFRAPDLFNERAVNYEDTLYKHPYRLMDFSNKSYELKDRWNHPVQIWGTAYSMPLSSYDIYEYPTERDIYIPLTMQDDFYEGEKVYIGDFTEPRENKTEAFINAMYYEDSYEVQLSLGYNASGILESSNLLTKVLEDNISHIQITSPVYPIYQDFKIYPSIEKTLYTAISGNLNLSGYRPATYSGIASGYVSGDGSLIKQISGLYDIVSGCISGSIAIEVHQNGNIFLPAQQFLSLYEDDLNFDVISGITYHPTGINKDGFIKSGDILIKEAALTTTGESEDKKSFVSEICGLEGGLLKISIAKPFKLSPSQIKTFVTDVNAYDEARFGIVLQFSQNNQDSFNKKVVIFGKPEFHYVGPDYNGMFDIDEITFTISAIPRIKSNILLKLLYQDFTSLSIRKVKNLNTIFGDASGILPDENYYKYYYADEALKLLQNYTSFKDSIFELRNNFKSENESLKAVDSALREIRELFNYGDKYGALSGIISNYDSDCIDQLIIKGDKTTFSGLNNDLISGMKYYQSGLFEDLVNMLFPIEPEKDGISGKISGIIPQVQEIATIISGQENTGVWGLSGDYETLYNYFSGFVGFFDYSESLKQQVSGLLPEFKRRADNEIFAIAIQPTIYQIKEDILTVIQEELDFYNSTDAGKRPEEILNGTAFNALRGNLEIYKGYFAPYPNYNQVRSEIQSDLHHIDNVEVPYHPQEFQNNAYELLRQVEFFRAPFVQNPAEYEAYMNFFFSEIERFYRIFMEDLVDMPVFQENRVVRYPIEALIRKLEDAVDKFVNAFDAERDQYDYAISFVDAIFALFRYEVDIKVFHNFDIGDTSTELRDQLLEFYNEFKLNVENMSINNEEFVNYRTLFINKLNEYISVYNDQLKCVIAADLDRNYYSGLDTSGFTADQQNAYSDLLSIDRTLDKYLPNRGLLLKPLPSDIYLDTIPETNSSYSLLNNQDTYLGILQLKFDSYNNLDYGFIREYSNLGLMTEYSPGAVNTAEIIHKDKALLDPENYVSSVPYLREYTISGYNYFDLNQDIIKANEDTKEKKKFSYCELEWLELFLPENKKKNIEGEIPTKYEVEIRSIITKNSDKIEFIDEMSKLRINALTTGDQVIGPNIEDDTFIEYIDRANFAVRVNKTINVSGDFVLTYLTKYNLYPEEFTSSDFHDYRIDFAKSAKVGGPVLTDTGSILEHGVAGSSDYPNVSQNYVNGFIDVLSYRQDLLSNLKVQGEYQGFFNTIVKNIHNDSKDLSSYYTLPSVINYFGTAYLEVNAHRIYKKEYLMVKEVLDYFQDYLTDLSRASDVVNVGVNIIAATDTTGNLSTDPGATYTDPNINLRFITNGWSTTHTIPSYIELGTGCLEDLFGDFSTADPQSRTEQPKFYYNYDVYDGHEVSNGAVPLESADEFTTYQELETEGITLANETGAMWSAVDIETTMDDTPQYIAHVDKPVLTMKLGEYEVQKNICFDNYLNPSKKWTTVQFSVIKQCFKNLIVAGKPIKQFTKNFVEMRILENVSNNYLTYTNAEGATITLVGSNDLLNTLYRDEWEPSYILDDQGRKVINYPPAETGNDLYYYSIIQSATLSSVYDPQTSITNTVSYKFGTILVWENSKWVVKDFTFVGLLGSQTMTQSNLVDGTDANVSISNPPLLPGTQMKLKGQNEDGEDEYEFATLKISLISKLLKSASIENFSTTADDLNNFSEANLTKIFEWICEERNASTIDWTGFNDDEREVLEEITSFKSEYKFSKNSVYWFYVAALDPNDPWGTAFASITEDPKIFGLYYSNGTFKIFLLSSYKMFYLIDHSRKVGIPADEWNTFIGKWGSTTNKLFPWEIISLYQNTLKLPYSNLIEGSVDISWKLMPHFLVSGHPYNGNTLLTETNNYDITQDNIYYDKINNNLYSYNDNKKIKFSIIQENNKYFKNLLYIYGEYNEDTITQGTNIVEQGKITGIPGINFDSLSASLKDRILEVEQINVRSPHNINLESTQFSSYLNLTGIIKGIYVEDPSNVNSDKYLSVGYSDAAEPLLTSKRLQYASELNKIFPLRYNSTTEQNERWPYQTIDFDNAAWSNGPKLTSPNIQKTEIFRDLTLNADQTVFKYFKNTLILEGKIDITNPGYIDFSDNTKLGDALSKITTGDKIVSIVGLNTLTSNSYKQFKVFNGASESGLKLQFLDYNQGFLIGAGDSGYWIFACADFNNLGTLDESGGFYKIDATHYTYASETTYTYSKITSLSYDEKNIQWIFALSRDNQPSDIYSLKQTSSTPPPNGVWEFETIYKDLAGYDINTYQAITIVDQNFEDITRNTTAQVFARDVSFDYLNPSKIITKEADVTLADTDFVARSGNATIASAAERNLNGVTRQNGISFTVTGKSIVDLKNRISVVGVGYKVATFILGKKDLGTTNQDHSISIGAFNDSTNAPNNPVRELWTYNHSTGMWEVSRNMKVFNNFVTEYDAVGVYIPVTAYIVNDSFLKLNTRSEFVLEDLPVPSINTVAIVLEDVTIGTIPDYTMKLQVEMTGTGTSTFELYDFRITTPKEINNSLTAQTPTASDRNYNENPYNPLTNGFNISGFNNLYHEARWNSNSWATYYGAYQAVIIGNTLFLKSPTRIVTDLSNGIYKYTNNVTTDYHWKRAELPSVADMSYSLLNGMTLEQAYNFVKSQFDTVKAKVAAELSTGSSLSADETAAYEALRDFLNRKVKDALDNEYEGPYRFTTDEDLPVEILEKGVRLYQTEKGLIPYFISNDTSSGYPWKSTQDSKFELGNVIDVYLKRQNYLRYLSEYSSGILGIKRFEYFFDPDGIKDVKLTANALIIQTKYDDILTLEKQYFSSRKDIENYNNWNVSNIDEDYIFGDPDETLDRVIGVKTSTLDRFIPVSLMPVVYPEKKFTLLNKYIENNVSVYCGYIKADGDVTTFFSANPDLQDTLMDLFPNNKTNSTTHQLFPTKYPVIFYSTDNKNFTKCNIPALEFIIELQNFTDTNSVNDIEAFSIVKEGSVLKVWMRDKNKVKGYSSFTVGISGTTLTLTYNADIVPVTITDENNITQQTVKELKNGFVNSLNSIITGSFTEDGVLTDSQFLVYQQYRPDVSNATISQKNDAAITFVPAPVESTTQEILNVLVAIDTTYLIEDQSDYVGYDTKYLDTVNNRYKVPEFVEVADKNSANRMYSPRECMVVRPATDFDTTNLYPREIPPKTGMPAISEDIDHLVYEYYDPFINETGVTVYNYREAKNSEDGYIMLCDINGNYLAQRDITSVSQIYNLRTLIQSNMPVSELAKAPIVKEGFSAVTKNDYFTNLIEGLTNKNIKYISFSSTGPLLYLRIKNCNDVIQYYRGLRNGAYNTDNEQFYRWPTSDLSNLYYATTSATGATVSASDKDFVAARNYIEQFEGIFTAAEKPFNGRFVPYTIDSINYIMDSSTNTLMIKEHETIVNNYNVPFIFENGFQMFSNKGFLKNGNTLLSPNSDYPITGMYIPTGGYGGYLNNTNWAERFDEIDYGAWDHEHFLLNQFNEYIYQTDYRGNIMYLKHGLFFSQTATISYSNLTKEHNIFTISDNLTSPKSTYNLYKIPPSPPEIYSPKSAIWFNHKYSTTNENPNLLALIKVIKAGIKVTSLSDYTITFLDYENKPAVIRSQNGSVAPSTCYLALENLGTDTYEEYFLTYHWTGSNNELPTIDGNILKLKITDKFGQIAIKEFTVQDSSEPETLRIIGITESYLFGNSFVNNNFTDITFDRNSILLNEEVLKSEDLNMVPNELLIRKELYTTANPTVNIVFRNAPISNKVFYYSNLFSFDIDLRHLDINFYVIKNWTTISSPSATQLRTDLVPKIYSGDNDISSEFTISYSILNNNFVATINSLHFYQPFVVKTETLNTITGINYIYLQDSAEQAVNFGKNVLIDGLYGSVLFKVPNYNSFADLIDKLDKIIEYPVRKILSTIDPFTKQEFNRITEIASNGSYLTLENLIDVEAGSYLKIKILPVQSIYPELKTANNPEYFYEITQIETKTFGIDRIWINSRAYPPPPISINNIIYNQNSIPNYYENNWLNKDSYKIYSCNEVGRFVKYTPSGHNLITQVLGNSAGDIRTDVFGSQDARYNPLEPVYKSSLDWFLSIYYIEGKESNPFILELNLGEEIKNKKYNQEMKVTQKIKLDNSFINQEVNDSYISKILNNVKYEPNTDAGIIDQDFTVDFIDYTTGEVNFSLVEPRDTYRDNERLFLYGINYYNQYYINNMGTELRLVWSSICNIDNKIDMSFDINSFENYLDKKNKDYAVRWFTEMGIFDQFGHLVAYMHHPKVEYRTDSQHLSYTCLIEEEN